MLYRPNEPGALTVDAPESELAGRGERLAAWLIDAALYAVAVIVTLVIAVIAIIVFGIADDGFENIGDYFDEEFFVVLALFALLFFLALLAVFIVQMVLLATRGQTIGKILLKIRVVDATTGEHPGWVRLVLLRTILNSIISTVLGAIPFVGGMFAIAYFLTDSLFIFRDDRRTIHDHIAHTRVDKVVG
ncbi:MAG: RDD family protein [Chloroflexi bacterium]|nr:RDD family protein [Chloroflexota bacterium]